jgi:hypothetical protein
VPVELATAAQLLLQDAKGLAAYERACGARGVALLPLRPPGASEEETEAWQLIGGLLEQKLREFATTLVDDYRWLLKRADAKGGRGGGGERKAKGKSKGVGDGEGEECEGEDELAVNCRLVAAGEKEVIAGVLEAIYSAGDGDGDEEEEEEEEEEEAPRKRR